MRAVLFDIDGTLLETDGAGKRAFSASIDLVLGLDDPLEYIVWAGATDLGVLRQVTERHELPWPEDLLEDFFHCLGEQTGRVLTETGSTRLFHGVSECVHTLHHTPGIHLSLLTGNGRASAIQKVKHGRLLDYFNPQLGGYGDEHAHRPELARRAKKRLRDHGLEGVPMVVIGDTPNDVEAAHAISAKAIGVATGHFNAEQLRAAGADAVFEDLSELDRVMAEVCGA